jgi:hypothetical protein
MNRSTLTALALATLLALTGAASPASAREKCDILKNYSKYRYVSVTCWEGVYEARMYGLLIGKGYANWREAEQAALATGEQHGQWCKSDRCTGYRTKN